MINNEMVYNEWGGEVGDGWVCGWGVDDLLIADTRKGTLGGFFVPPCNNNFTAAAASASSLRFCLRSRAIFRS